MKPPGCELRGIRQRGNIGQRAE